ncbi:MAG: hypothetical protein JNK78_16080 [Planctomycetes bacterium]|nr:hypothetical protein [Planctomycetota bacterium]
MNIALHAAKCSTFACLAAAPLAQDALHADIAHALDAARPALLAHLKEASSDVRPFGELALLLLAASHDGVDPANDTFAAAVQRLATATPSQTYDVALRLLVMEATPTFPHRLEIARRDAAQLLRYRSGGGFSYNDGSGWDLSNTQYGALGLRAAKGLGVAIDKSVWSKLANAVGGAQGSYGGFGYEDYGGGDSAYASMTVAGIAVLAICAQAIGGEKVQADMSRHIERGWRWLEKNAKAIGSPTESWSFYFHYGLERAAILCDKEKVGTTDWYETGARMFLASQLSGGGWMSASDGYPGTQLDRGRGHGVPTAFAVLFLRRKFQKELGPITPHVVLLVNVGPMSKQKDVDECTDELVRRGKEAVPDVLKALRSDVAPRRRAAAAALAKIAGDGFGIDPALEPDANAEALRRAELWHLRNR